MFWRTKQVNTNQMDAITQGVTINKARWYVSQGLPTKLEQVAVRLTRWKTRVYQRYLLMQSPILLAECLFYKTIFPSSTPHSGASLANNWSIIFLLEEKLKKKWQSTLKVTWAFSESECTQHNTHTQTGRMRYVIFEWCSIYWSTFWNVRLKVVISKSWSWPLSVNVYE